MIFTKTDIEGLVIIETKKYVDDRGYFFESYQHEKFCDYLGQEITFVQENESMSSINVIRGLHFQKAPFAQGKLVRVSYGKVIDIVVDIRSKSITYGQTFAIELSQENGKQLWIPEGFAHGFIVTKDNTEFSYKCDNFYDKENDRGISILDPMLDIAIPFPKDEMIISEKDANLPAFADAQDILIFL